MLHAVAEVAAEALATGCELLAWFGMGAPCGFMIDMEGRFKLSAVCCGRCFRWASIVFPVFPSLGLPISVCWFLCLRLDVTQRRSRHRSFRVLLSQLVCVWIAEMAKAAHNAIMGGLQCQVRLVLALLDVVAAFCVRSCLSCPPRKHAVRLSSCLVEPLVQRGFLWCLSRALDLAVPAAG
jgi:hypothetical protein